ncbi:hypothetical protein LUZ60_015255 [Juncus effusus]|nr:hypothetical protein LUZ60_015255 [Juncus effusus]
MDGKKNANGNSSSIVDELFGKEEAKHSTNGGYFSSVFGPQSTNIKGKDTSRADSNWSTNKQNDGKSDGNYSTKNQNTYYKDGKTVYQPESNESSYFGSSVHYGARDFYGTSSSKHVIEPAKSYKNEESDDSIATRGDWWQGSLYY